MAPNLVGLVSFKKRNVDTETPGAPEHAGRTGELTARRRPSARSGERPQES